MKARVLLAIGIAVLVAIAVYWLARGGDAPTTSAGRSKPSASSNSPGADPTPSPPASPDARPAVAPRPAHTAAERTAMLEAIATARSRRTATPHPTSGTSGGGGDDDTPGATTLDIHDRTGDTSAWEKRTLGVLNGLLGECYDLGRAEDPKLEGKLKLRFTLVGEPKVGGLLESVEIVDDGFTTITQQTLRDCMSQQLYALELDPPPDGVRVEREVTLQFP